MMKTVEKPAKALMQQRDQWFDQLDISDKEERLFELEMLLIGLDRFFNVKNLPITQAEYIVSKNFADEVKIVKEMMVRMICLIEALLQTSHNKIAYTLKRYVGTALAKDHSRSTIRESMLVQNNPEESLYVLLVGVQHIRGVLDGLIQLPRCSYQVFMAVANVVRRELICNRFFNPSRLKKFRPEFDRIWNRRIIKILKKIEDKEVYRRMSIAIIYLFRLLHYLTFIDSAKEERYSLKSTLLIFALLYSESRYLLTFMEKDLLALLKQKPYRTKYKELYNTVDSLLFQLQMELKRLAQKEMRAITEAGDTVKLFINIENCQGLLRNFYYQSIYELVHVFDKEVKSRDLDVYFATKLKNSIQLRSNVWRFLKIMDKFEEQAQQLGQVDKAEQAAFYIKYFHALYSFTGYFQEECSKLLRYDDYVEFRKFFDFVQGLTEQDFKENSEETLRIFVKQCHEYKIFTEALFEKINKRSELVEAPFAEEEEAKELVGFFKKLIKGKKEQTASGV